MIVKEKNFLVMNQLSVQNVVKKVTDMQEIKSYTDIEQSRKLAEILPLESADMYYILMPDNVYNHFPLTGRKTELADDTDIPCWSLTALLAILPNDIITDDRFECHYQIHIRKYDGGDNTTFYQIAYGNARGSSGSWHDMISTGETENLVDCCAQMILKLRELNLL